MNLKAIINGVEYSNIIQGVVLKDEYNENLDSGSLIIDHVKELSIKPFDIVYLFNSDKSFEKYYCIEAYSRELLNTQENIYTYRIGLCSTTKLLEKIQLPNLTITAGLNRSVWWYMEYYVNFYSPKIRVRDGSGIRYVNEYTLDETSGFYSRNNNGKFITFKDYFSSRICPEMSWSTPNLREVLTRLAQVFDCIPILNKKKISFINIAVPNGMFNLTKDMGAIKEDYSIDDYSDALTLDLENGLDLDDESLLTHNVEYVGFRDLNNAVVSIQNNTAKLIVNNPIYKINKLYMCYPIIAEFTLQAEDGATYTTSGTLMAKWDITKLVLLQEKRNNLKEDMVSDGWVAIRDANDNITGYEPKSGQGAFDLTRTWEEIIDIAKNYKFATLQYSIGERVISGFDDFYSKVTGAFFWLMTDQPYSVVEGIFETAFKKRPIGTDIDVSEILELVNQKNYLFDGKKIVKIIGARYLKDLEPKFTQWLDTGDLTRYDYLTFQVDYYSLKSPRILFSKKGTNGSVVNTDKGTNALSNITALSNLEYNKIDRMGNARYTSSARYTNFKDINKCGSNYITSDGKNIIFYRREIAIYNNYYLVSYEGRKDYILQNYFTSINAKIRAWQNASVSNAVKRKDNKLLYIEFSENKIIDDYSTPYGRFNYKNNIYDYLLSPFIVPTINQYTQREDKLPIVKRGYLVGDEKYYSKMEIETTVAKNALCLTFNVVDNITNGTYISDNIVNENDLDKKQLKNGFYQDWVPYAPEGWLDQIRVGAYSILNINKDILYFGDDLSVVTEDIDFFVTHSYFPKLNQIPVFSPSESREYENRYFYVEFNFLNYYKDNKEIPNITLELELISNSNNIKIGEAYWKASAMVENSVNYRSYEVDDLSSFEIETNLTLAKGIPNFEANCKAFYYYTFLATYPITLYISAFALMYLDNADIINIPLNYYQDGELKTAKIIEFTRPSLDYVPLGVAPIMYPDVEKYGRITISIGGQEVILTASSLEGNGTIVFTNASDNPLTGDITNMPSSTPLPSFNYVIFNSSYTVREEFEDSTSRMKLIYDGMTYNYLRGSKRYILVNDNAGGVNFEDKMIMDLSNGASTITLYENPTTINNGTVPYTLEAVFPFKLDVDAINNISVSVKMGVAFLLSDNDDEVQEIKQNIFVSFYSNTYNKYEINNEGLLGEKQDISIDTIFSVDLNDHSIYIDWSKVSSTVNFIGLYYFYNNKYNLIFGVNRGVDKVYCNIKQLKNNLVYESQDKQNPVGEIGEVKNNIYNSNKYASLKKIY